MINYEKKMNFEDHFVIKIILPRSQRLSKDSIQKKECIKHLIGRFLVLIRI